MSLSVSRLKDVLDYDSESGVFKWKIVRGPTKKGSVAGTVNPAAHHNGGGYRQICVDGRKHYAHRLAWLYVTGEWPAGQIDHVNMVRDDNRFANLRAATRAENNANRAVRSNSKSGIKGASYRPEKRAWRARIRVDGVDILLGHFATADMAHNAYVAAAKRYYGNFSRAS